MFSAKKYFYFLITLCFFIQLLSFHLLWAEGGSKKKVSDQQRAESKPEPVSAKEQPQLSIDATRYDAGEVWEGDRISHTFIVKNTGTAQLNISKVRPG